MQTLVIDYLYGVIWTYKVAHIEGMDRVWPRFDYIGYSVTVTYVRLACSGSPAAGSKKKYTTPGHIKSGFHADVQKHVFAAKTAHCCATSPPS